MRYVFVEREVAERRGFNLKGHRITTSGLALLNEKEVTQKEMGSPTDFDGRCESMGGIINTLEEINHKLATKEIVWEQ